jgi:dihydroflavonol-4-reductase
MAEVTEGGTRNLLAAARAARCKRFVFVSTAATINASDRPMVFDEAATFDLDDRDLSYCRHKRAAERICLEANDAGLPVVIVNPTEVYGPNDTALITAGNLVDFAKSSPVMVCSGGTSVAHVDDVAQGIVRAFARGRGGERYILGGENLTVKELAELTLKILGQKKRVVTLPNAVIRGVAKGGLALGVPLPFNPRVIPYATRYWFMDSSKAQRELGATFRPARAALEPTLAWLERAGHIGTRARPTASSAGNEGVGGVGTIAR